VPTIVYASGYGQKIQWLSVDADGQPTPSGSITSFGTAPSYLAIDRARSRLYAIDEATPGRVGAYAIDRRTGALSFLNAVSSGGDGPAFIAIHSHGWVLVAHYTSGSVAVLRTQADGSMGDLVDLRTSGARAHMILPDSTGRQVFVPCLGADRIVQYHFDAARGTLAPNAAVCLATAAGAGPRHLALHPHGARAYLLNELDSTMTALAIDRDSGALSAFQTVSALPDGYAGTNTAAAVKVHPSGRWLFGSNRGHDSIALFSLDAAGKMTRRGFTPTGGARPRDIALDPAGRFLYVANEGTGTLTWLAFDETSGALIRAAGEVRVPSATFVETVALPITEPRGRSDESPSRE
jgi:6-phosphogluconolactonase